MTVCKYTVSTILHLCKSLVVLAVVVLVLAVSSSPCAVCTFTVTVVLLLSWSRGGGNATLQLPEALNQPTNHKASLKFFLKIILFYPLSPGRKQRSDENAWLDFHITVMAGEEKRCSETLLQPLPSLPSPPPHHHQRRLHSGDLLF